MSNNRRISSLSTALGILASAALAFFALAPTRAEEPEP